MKINEGKKSNGNEKHPQFSINLGSNSRNYTNPKTTSIDGTYFHVQRRSLGIYPTTSAAMTLDLQGNSFFSNSFDPKELWRNYMIFTQSFSPNFTIFLHEPYSNSLFEFILLDNIPRS